MEEAITALLLADARVRYLVSDRLHWGRLPQSVTGTPYVILTVIGGLPDYVASGRSGLKQSRLQIDGYATTPTVARDCVDAVVRVLELSRGIFSGVRLQGGTVAGERDSQPESPAGKAALYRRSTDFMLWHSA
ncbi:tail completion protein gp17 [Ciceribacter ferrooxidans]|uniref:DUF3168 domain-containing protein n=1 Tax=Ciceribacter ferrooxidans TaxID=2509717 RepID=A0A4Q2SW48_9HYPH|nr:DUF3168 domain-containing protein [Ciceribacter ferrooxidans]RYC10072.1 DUF3168 domain-containing protein [Ciceribacter ferrooxidans]